MKMLTLEQAFRMNPAAVEELFDFTASLRDETGCPYAYESVGKLVSEIVNGNAKFEHIIGLPVTSLRFTTTLGYTGVWNEEEVHWEWFYV